MGAKREQNEAILEEATRRALTRAESRDLRKAILASKGDSDLSGQVVDLLYESSVLLTLARTVTRSFALDVLLPDVIDVVVAAFEADRGTVFLLDPDTGQMFARYKDLKGVREIRVAPDAGIAGLVLNSGEPILVPDTDQDPRFNPDVDKGTGQRTRCVLAAPLRTPRGDIIGVAELLDGEPNRFDQTDLQLFARAMAQVAVPLENARLLEELELHRTLQQRAAGELAAGWQIQMGLLPRTDPAFPDRTDLDISASIEPAKPMGGDFYDLVLTPDERLYFVIGDVSGKGVPASVLMAVVHTLFRSHVRRGAPGIDGVATRVNCELWQEDPEQLFVTAFCGVLDLKTGEVEFVVAGHDPPFVLRKAGVDRLSAPPQPALAMDPDVHYHCASALLHPGDTLVFFTDGVSEAMDAGAHPMGTDRIRAALAQVPHGSAAEQSVAAVKRAVLEWRAGLPAFDDTTVLAIRWLGAERA